VRYAVLNFTLRPVVFFSDGRPPRLISTASPGWNWRRWLTTREADCDLA